jgi:hypothetical protein
MQLGAVKYLIKNQISIWSMGMWTIGIIQQGADTRLGLLCLVFPFE